MNFKKILFSAITISFLSISSIYANEIDKLIQDMDFELKSDISVFVQNKNDKKIIYKKNENKPLNPASLLKVLTFGASYLVLGDDYKFETSLYQNNNDYYIKLGGDVLLSQKDLNNLISNLKTKKIDNLYIDSSIIDKTPYPNTWKDEDLWPNSKLLTPYIIDKNEVKISLHRSSLATKVDIIQENDYKFPIINELKIGDFQNYTYKKEYGENSSIISFKGTISEDETINLPILKPEINFNIKLKKALAKNKIVYTDIITEKNIPQNSQKIASVNHNIKEISKLILHNSDNFASEIVFKVASAKYCNFQKSGNLEDAVSMFNSIFKKHLNKNTKIADASGVSRENLITTKTYIAIFNELLTTTDIKNLLAQPNNGTLEDRMLYLNSSINAKTGTLRNFSALSGEIKTKENNNLIFAIITQNSDKRKGLLKYFEERLVSLLYKNY